jgi:hypothetical protein
MTPPTLTYRERIVALGLALRVRAGEMVNVEIRHASDCDLLHGRDPCTCVPSIAANVRGRLWRVTSDGFVFSDATVPLH